MSSSDDGGAFRYAEQVLSLDCHIPKKTTARHDVCQ